MCKLVALLMLMFVACGCEPGYMEPSLGGDETETPVTPPSDSTDMSSPSEGDDSSYNEVWGEGGEVIL